MKPRVKHVYLKIDNFLPHIKKRKQINKQNSLLTLNKTLVLFVLFTFITLIHSVITPLYATQSNNIMFKHLLLEEGLSQSVVQCITQDNRGFMWFGTQDGLNRYDGYVFKIYKHDPIDPFSISDNAIQTIFKDSDGILWIGTFGGGLNKFDPKTELFTHFLNNPNNTLSISNNDVRCIVEDQNHNLWVGTNGGGLNKVNKKTGTATRFIHNDKNTNSLSDDRVLSLSVDNSNCLWIGTNGGGLNKFNPKTGQFTVYRYEKKSPDGLRDDQITCLLFDSKNCLWIGFDDSGLQKFDPKTGKFKSFTAPPEKNKQEIEAFSPNSTYLNDNRIATIYEDRAGIIWIGSYSSGLDKMIDRNKGIFTHISRNPSNPYSLSHNSIRSIYEDSTGILWVGTFGGGLNKFDRHTLQFSLYAQEISGNSNFNSNPKLNLTQNMVWAIYQDRMGYLWIGTEEKLNKIDRKTGYVTTYQNRPNDPQSISSNYVRCITEDSWGFLWIGTDGGGLNKLDRQSGKFTRFESTHEPTKTGFKRNPASKNGTKPSNDFSQNPGKSKSLCNNKVWTIHEDRYKTLWIGTENGLDKLEKNNRVDGLFTHYVNNPSNPNSLPINDIRYIYEDRSGTLWLGTNGGGLCKYIRESDSFRNYSYSPNIKNSISHNRIRSIYEDEGGTLWIGTDGGGLNKYDKKTDSFTSYHQKNGLPNDVIYGILEDRRGTLWISTNNGLSHFAPKHMTFQNYNSEDGLQNNEFNTGAFFKNKSGEMFFGGISGFNSFFPQNISNDPFIPTVVITDFLLSNKSVPAPRPLAGYSSNVASNLSRIFYRTSSILRRPIYETKKITLSYTDSVFTFEFAALHFANPGKNRYKYFMEGVNSKEWLETDSHNRRATYTYLPPGKYVFHVKACNKDGIWNNEGTAVEVEILPPFWRTFWAYAIYTIIILTILFLIILFQRRKLLYERSIAQRLIQVDKLKDEFLSNTSHELRTPLNGIIGLTESLIDGAAGAVDEKLKKNLSMIASSGKRLANLVNDILDFSKLKNKNIELQKKAVDMNSITNVVLALSAPLTATKDIELVNAIPPDIPLVHGDENRLQQIMFNLISNSIKFTESGLVKVSAKINPDTNGMLLITVSDTGIGIPEDKWEIIFESFEQVESSSQRTYGGTGLGLAITRQLVSLHGGKIWVNSVLGNGSTFYFTIPVFSSATFPSEDVLKPSITHQLSSNHTQKFLTTKNVTGEVIKSGKPEANTSKFPIISLTGPTHEEIKRKTKTTSKPFNLNPYHILVVDDDPINRHVIINLLQLQHYTVTEISSGFQALELIKENRSFDMVLLDTMMPRISGYEVCMRIREQYSAHELPVIFLTAKNQESDIIASFNSGGNDFISKPVTKGELITRVKTHLELLEINRNLEKKVKDRTQELELKNNKLSELNIQLEEASLTDPLTGLWNRRYINKTIHQDLTLAERTYEIEYKDNIPFSSAKDIAFIIIDIDHFKSINDIYKHHVGDMVLKQVADIMRKECRGSDILIRWGGEEFLIVSRFTSRFQAEFFCERLRNAVASYKFKIEDGKTLHVTCSLGFACYPFLPHHPRSMAFDWETVISIADIMMYKSKNSGRNAWSGVLATLNAKPDNLYPRLQENFNEILDTGEIVIRKSY